MKERVLVTTPTLYSNNSPWSKLYKSCEVFQISLLPYGNGKDYAGWVQTKVVLLLEFLKDKLDQYDLLLFTDAGDTWYLSNLDEIVEKYYKLNSDHILSGERVMWPIGEHAPKYISRFPKDYKADWGFLNTGGQIGKIKTIYDNWKLAYDKYSYLMPIIGNDDGALLSTAFVNDDIEIGIDYYCDIFMGMGGRGIQETMDIQNNRLHNKITNSYPCSIHFNSMPKDPAMTEVYNMWLNLEHNHA